MACLKYLSLVGHLVTPWNFANRVCRKSWILVSPAAQFMAVSTHKEQELTTSPTSSSLTTRWKSMLTTVLRLLRLLSLPLISLDRLSLRPPSETNGNNDSSLICKELSDTCNVTYQAFNDDFIYKDYTYYSTIEGDTSWVNFSLVGNGCKAEFKCDDYGDGMSGKHIKKA